ncbi:hypothetical protein I4U23_023585 [Adineta vaga]|nr:hypothetical protein I4U23_023585 [Adineta vaga]
MSSVPINSTLILTINDLSFNLNRYLSIIIFIFGTIGNLLNCLALSQRTLRSNPCATLFLASSIASIITLISGVAVRLLAGWSADLTDTSNSLCKIRIFILFTSRTIASWFITLATCDRWLSSSLHANHRRLSTLRNAQRGMIIIILLCFLLYAQIFYCYEANLVDSPLKCYGRTTWCRLLIDSEFTSIGVLLPSILMFIFGFLTIVNTRQMTRRRLELVTMNANTQVVTLNEQHSWRVKKTDQHLLFMLLVQVILLTLFSLPQAIQNLYANATRYEIRSSVQIAKNNFIFNLFILLTYVTNGMPFYIYTLSGGKVFRQGLFNRIQNFLQKITCH